LQSGFSSVLALGAPPNEPAGWKIGICDPRDPNYRVACVRLKDRALGTSAATFQHLVYEGRKLGHILDPRSGWPAEGMLSASVLAPSAAVADALATAFFIDGVEKARRYCQAHPEMAAVLIPSPEPGQPVEVICVGAVVAEVFSRPVAIAASRPAN
jgi:thiamine biosynthesis lipoprotein